MRKLALFLLLIPLSLKACDPLATAEMLMGKSLAKDTVFTNLPGLTNKNYLFADETGGRYVVRIPGSGTETFIDRHTEFVNSKKAHLLGFNPAHIVYSDIHGSQITKYIENFTSYSFEDFYRPDVIQQVASFLKKIHSSELHFTNRIDLFDRADRLKNFLEKHQVALTPEFYLVSKYLSTLEQDLALPCFVQVPVHGDPVPSNFMVVADKLMLLDWEYSGLSDPAWDLAFLSSVMNYSDELEKQLLGSYGDSDPAILRAKMHLFKPLAEYWLALWGFSQTLVCSADQQDFFRYFSLARLGRMQRLLESPAYINAQALVRVWEPNPLYEKDGKTYLKFYTHSQAPLLTAFPSLSKEILLIPVQFNLWICPYCGILNPIEKRCCISPNCMTQ